MFKGINAIDFNKCFSSNEGLLSIFDRSKWVIRFSCSRWLFGSNSNALIITGAVSNVL